MDRLTFRTKRRHSDRPTLFDTSDLSDSRSEDVVVNQPPQDEDTLISFSHSWPSPLNQETKEPSPQRRFSFYQPASSSEEWETLVPQSKVEPLSLSKPKEQTDYRTQAHDESDQQLDERIPLSPAADPSEPELVLGSSNDDDENDGPDLEAVCVKDDDTTDCLSPLRTHGNSQVALSPIPRPPVDQMTPTISNTTSRRVNSSLATNDDEDSSEHDYDPACESPQVALPMMKNETKFVASSGDELTSVLPLLPSALSFNQFSIAKQTADDAQSRPNAALLDNEKSRNAVVGSAHQSRPDPPVNDWSLSLSRFRRAAASATETFIQVAKPLADEVGTMASGIASETIIRNVAGSSVVSEDVSAGEKTVSPLCQQHEFHDKDASERRTGTPAITPTDGDIILDDSNALLNVISMSSAKDVSVNSASASNDEKSTTEPAVDTQQFPEWSRLMRAAASTAKSALNASTPVVADAGNLLKDIHTTGLMDDASSRGRKRENITSKRPELIQTRVPSPQPLGNVDASISGEPDPIAGNAKLPANIGRTNPHGGDGKDRLEIPTPQPSQTTATSTLTLEIPGGLVEYLSETVHTLPFTSSKSTESRWLRPFRGAPTGHPVEVSAMSTSSSVSSPASPIADHSVDSSFDDEFDDDMSGDVTMESDSRQDQRHPSLSACWDTFMVLGNRREDKLTPTQTKRAIPTEYVVMTTRRPSTSTSRDVDNTEGDSTFNASFSSDMASIVKSAPRKRRSLLGSSPAAQRKLVNSASFGLLPTSLGDSMHGSRHRRASVCATFPVTDDSSHLKNGMASSVGLSPELLPPRPTNRRGSQPERLLSPTKKNARRVNSPLPTSVHNRKASLAPIFRSLDEKGTSNAPVSPKENVDSASLGKSPRQSNSQRQHMRRASSMPVLPVAHPSSASIQGSLRSSPTPDDVSLLELSVPCRFLEYKGSAEAKTSSTSIGTRPEGDQISFQRLDNVEEETLEDVLVDFASVETIAYPFRDHDFTDELLQAANIRWQQLVAFWKHAECLKSMELSRSSQEAMDLSPGETNRGPKIRLDDEQHFDVPSISPFFLGLGEKQASAITEVGSNLHHQMLPLSSVADLHKSACEFRELFTDLIKDVVSFAENEQTRSGSRFKENWHEKSAHHIPYTVSTKDIEAVQRKAMRKYGGDVSQVKDILRGRIIFPDESSLVCGLVRLYQRTGKRDPTEKSIAICRIKNLFAPDAYAPVLPTGYRHVLLNILFDDCVVAGK